MSDRIWRYKTYDSDEPDFKDQYYTKPIDKLERLLEPIYRRYAKHPERNDARLAFCRDIRWVIKLSGYKSPEEVWDISGGAKKSGFEDGVKWEQHRRVIELTKEG